MIYFFLSSRFKENNIIDKELYNYNNTLEITAEHGLNGSYRCRVVNDFGTEFSERAILEIIGLYLVSLQYRYNNKINFTTTKSPSTLDSGHCLKAGFPVIYFCIFSSRGRCRLLFFQTEFQEYNPSPRMCCENNRRPDCRRWRV